MSARKGGAVPNLQAITTNRGPVERVAQIPWFPDTRLKGAALSRAFRLLGAGDVRRKLGI